MLAKQTTVLPEIASTATFVDGDYQPLASDILTFQPGEIVRTVSVTVNDDRSDEPDETVIGRLSELTSNDPAVRLGQKTDAGIIVNDDVLRPSFFFQANPDILSTDENSPASAVGLFSETFAGDVTGEAGFENAYAPLDFRGAGGEIAVSGGVIQLPVRDVRWQSVLIATTNSVVCCRLRNQRCPKNEVLFGPASSFRTGT